jgi:hypothetical protein
MEKSVKKENRSFAVKLNARRTQKSEIRLVDAGAYAAKAIRVRIEWVS